MKESIKLINKHNKEVICVLSKQLFYDDKPFPTISAVGRHLGIVPTKMKMIMRQKGHLNKDNPSVVIEGKILRYVLM